jgi:hypothetical protein
MSDEMFHYLRRIKLDSLLILIANEIGGMFERNKPMINIPVIRFNGPLYQKGNVTVLAWNLSDLAYLAIQKSNDFRKIEPSSNDLVTLCNLFLAWDNKRSSEEYDGLDKNEMLLKMMVGLSQKQFWYQEIHRIREEFNRQVELLEVIPSQIGSQVDLEGACKDVSGFDLRTFRTILLALFSVALHQSDLSYLTSDGSLLDIHPALTVQNVLQVADLYTGDYQEFRQSPLLENHFFVKPIVRTSFNRLIAVNTYMFAKKVADGPFWIIRDYYLNKGSQAFVNVFGGYFEYYVEKLLQHCLPSESFARVSPPKSGKYADWFVYTQNYRIIIELKSSIAGLMMRRLYPDIESIRNYLEKFQEGVLQLDSTAQAFPEPSRTTIKLLVHYETFYLSDGLLRPHVIDAIKGKLTNTEHVYFCDIGEFEWFISLLQDSEALAERILAAKIDTNFAEGREFSQVIPRITDIGNRYIKNTLNHWDNYIPGLSNKAP